MKRPATPPNLADFSWDDLRVVVVASHAGSLSGAARRLGLSVATVGRRIERLEEALGRKLFHRHSGGLKATHEAGLLLERAEQVAAHVEDFKRAAAAQQETAEGTVTVSTLETVITHVIAPRLVRFRKRHPGVRLILRSSARIVRLDRRDADIAVRIVRPSEARVVGRKLGTLRYGLYASESYLERHETPSVDELGAHDVVMYDRNWDGLPEMAWLVERLDGAEPAIRVNTAAAIRASIRSGAAVGLLPTFLAARGMKRLAGPEGLPTRDVWMVIHEDLRHAAHVRAAADFLIEAAGEALD